jgi:hypothetical protein
MKNSNSTVEKDLKNLTVKKYLKIIIKKKFDLHILFQ